VDRPLVIKVASISSARLQVYFIDNEDYFRRKQIKCDDKGKAFPDNGERALFFARGVLEAVKKQRWAPDIIHCHGWISHVLPLYLKKAYKDDPVFSGAKVVLSLYDDTPAETFADGLAQTILFGGIKPKDVPLPEKAGGMELAQLAAQYSDGIILGSAGVDPALQAYIGTLGKPILPFDAASLADGSYMDQYNAFYDSLLQ
jgi:starch synthase